VLLEAAVAPTDVEQADDGAAVGFVDAADAPAGERESGEREADPVHRHTPSRPEGLEAAGGLTDDLVAAADPRPFRHVRRSRCDGGATDV
jgi:hypothetical protein